MHELYERALPSTDFFAELQLAILKPLLPVLTRPVRLHPGFVPCSRVQKHNSPSLETLSMSSCSSRVEALLRAMGSTAINNFGGCESGRLFLE